MSTDGFLDIDVLQLDKELTKQAKLYHEHAVQMAQARKDLDEAESNLDLVQAKLDKQIRESPGRFGLDKTTEKSIENTIQLSSKYHTARQAAIDCKYALNVLVAATTALEHKKRALEKLVELFLADYFSEPRLPKHSEEEMTKRGARRKAKSALRDRDSD